MAASLCGPPRITTFRVSCSAGQLEEQEELQEEEEAMAELRTSVPKTLKS